MSQSGTTGATIVNPLVERLRSGGIGLSLMIKHARTVDIALAAKTCGFDALYFDLQHSTVPEDAVAQISAAAVQAGITPLVRIPEGGYGTALRLLDGGALGIVVPDLSTAEQARVAVSYCKFAPLGNRSNAGRYPQFAYRAIPAVQTREALNDNTLLIVMIESQAALENVEEIAAVPGVDIVHIGSSDLSADFGVPGQNTHPKVLAALLDAGVARERPFFHEAAEVSWADKSSWSGSTRSAGATRRGSSTPPGSASRLSPRLRRSHWCSARP